jgi:quercetin dioxygenase-like cupin family protein
MPRLAFNHIDDAPPQEVRPQMHGDRRVAVHIRTLESTPERVVMHTRYDPGLILRRHSHKGDAIIYIIEGDLMVGETPVRAGSSIILEKGTAFGPLVAGAQGTTFIEIYLGPEGSQSVGADDAAYERLLEERGVTLLPEPRFEVRRTDG